MPSPNLVETPSVLSRILDLRRQEMDEESTDESLNATGRIASDLTDEVLARPVRSWDDVVDRAAIAFYWQTKNNDGVMLALTPEDRSPDTRSAAELITAVLSLAEGGDHA